MLMIGIFVAVRVRMAGSVRVDVFVLVEDYFQPASKGIGDAAERGEARNVISPLQARDHGLGHRKPLGELFLRLAGEGAQFAQAMSALSGDGGAVVERRSTSGMSGGLLHRPDLARLRSRNLANLLSFGQSSM